MANAGMSKTLPSFLLPRLSWKTQTASFHHNSIRAVSSASSSLHHSSGRRAVQPQALINAIRCSGALRSRNSILQHPLHHRVFHATARRSRDHHFDTLKFVQRLQEEGFTEAQSVAMMKVLSDVIEERFDYLQTRLRPKTDSAKYPEPNSYHGPARRPSQSYLYPESGLREAPFRTSFRRLDRILHNASIA
jgi:hypothetical protein